MATLKTIKEGTNMLISFYPYVSGDEKAVIEIYGR